MKCIEKDGEIKRVSDRRAAVLVGQGWVYCPKSEWKARRSVHEADTIATDTNRPDWADNAKWVLDDDHR